MRRRVEARGLVKAAGSARAPTLHAIVTLGMDLAKALEPIRGPRKASAAKDAEKGNKGKSDSKQPLEAAAANAVY